MMTTIRSELLETLGALGKLYLSMRFGQLACMACSMVGEPYPPDIHEPPDDAVLAALQEHYRERLADLVSSNSAILPPQRIELVSALEELGTHYPEWSLGQLLFKLASIAHLNVYDAEDEELLAVIRSNKPGLQWFKRYTEKLAARSTVRERQDKQWYHCPCCRYRTLYERGGFEICPVCYWEDDGQDDEDAETVRGGPNGALSLAQGRENYRKFKVCEPRFADHVRPPRPAETKEATI